MPIETPQHFEIPEKREDIQNPDFYQTLYQKLQSKDSIDQETFTQILKQLEQKDQNF